ncbi:COG2363 [hydrothermal vent metagenome]|uniref:COG2363 n=1 Tax=hydrothermal vent metagenome TaxID=652676 RepID=A0A3B0WQD4_9ZZZZ
MYRKIIIAGAINAFIAVALGAFAAHGLKHRLNSYSMDIWQTAVDYHMTHALGLILIGILAKILDINLTKPGVIMLCGIALFSGSLYMLSLTGIKALGMITPFGGLCFLIAWAWLAISVSRK